MDFTEKARSLVISQIALKAKNPIYNELGDYIFEALKRIRSEMIMASTSGKTKIDTTLPNTFVIPNIPNKKCQAIVWRICIEALEKEGYIVKLHPTDKKCEVTVSWNDDDSDDAIMSYDYSYIAKHIE